MYDPGPIVEIRNRTRASKMIDSGIPLQGEAVYSVGRLRKIRIAKGLCRDCGKVPCLETKVVCQACHEKRSKSGKRNRANKTAKGQCFMCPMPSEIGKTHCKNCLEKHMQSFRIRRKENKEFIYKHFGSKCNFCNESDIRVMSLDHINSDGRLDKRSENGKRQITPTWYAKLIKLIKAGKDLPRDLQMLCFNCHFKKDLTPWWYYEN